MGNRYLDARPVERSYYIAGLFDALMIIDRGDSARSALHFSRCIAQNLPRMGLIMRCWTRCMVPHQKGNAATAPQSASGRSNIALKATPIPSTFRLATRNGKI